MIEILGLVVFCSTNKKNALKNGRKPKEFLVLTFVLWFAMELIGGFVGSQLTTQWFTAYEIALGFAVVGGVISFTITKNSKKGDYSPEAELAKLIEQTAAQAQPLAKSAQIVLTRDQSFVASLIPLSFALNGQPLCQLKNGGSYKFPVSRSRNVLVVSDKDGVKSKPFVFDIENGATAQIHFKPFRFNAKKTTGITPVA